MTFSTSITTRNTEERLNFREGIKQSFKADILSLSVWQVGMYGFMAFAHFYVFAVLFNQTLYVASIEFWFMMQIAMLAGFITAYPVPDRGVARTGSMPLHRLHTRMKIPEDPDCSSDHQEQYKASEENQLKLVAMGST